MKERAADARGAIERRLAALAVLFVGAALASASPRAVAIVAGALPIAGVVAGPRLELDRLGQAALAIVAMVGGVLVPRLLLGPEASRDDPAVLGERALLLAMPMLAVASARTLIERPVLGARVTLLAALVGLTAAGRAATGLVYPALAAAAVAVALAALAAEDPTRPKLGLLRARHVAAIAFGALAALALTVVAAVTLPRLQDAALARFLARYKNRSGFSDQMALGEMAGMLQSDAVVMRVRGGAPPLLRGALFTNYVAGRWEAEASRSGIEVVETPVEPAPGAPMVEIENAGKIRQYFVPLGARDVTVSTGVYERDVLQLHRPSARFEAKRLWFGEGGGPEPLAPRPADRQVPSRIKPALAAILSGWGVSQPDAAARVRAIEARLLADHRYSLSFDRTAGVDPVVDFLTTHREGHCEYFASALTLLARTADVPARLVAGYRVVESSPLGYRVVRERHAHSWVEVWIDGRWVTVDPTPAAVLAAASPETTPLGAAILDGIATAWERVDDWLGRRSPFELSLLLVGLTALLIGARALRARKARARPTEAGDPPLHGFAALARALARRGLARGPTETLAHYAERVAADAALPRPLGPRAAELVRRYELLRYGGRGDAAALDREMADAASAVAAANASAAAAAA